VLGAVARFRICLENLHMVQIRSNRSNLSSSTHVTLGLSLNRSAGGIGGNQATLDNSQRNNLRSCVYFGGIGFGSVGVGSPPRCGDLVGESLVLAGCR